MLHVLLALALPVFALDGAHLIGPRLEVQIPPPLGNMRAGVLAPLRFLLLPFARRHHRYALQRPRPGRGAKRPPLS